MMNQIPAEMKIVSGMIGILDDYEEEQQKAKAK